jgi:hypothetical protein
MVGLKLFTKINLGENGKERKAFHLLPILAVEVCE